MDCVNQYPIGSGEEPALGQPRTFPPSIETASFVKVCPITKSKSTWHRVETGVSSDDLNRRAIAGLFGISAIIVHDKWRRDRSRPRACLGPMLLALGLLTAEMAVATTGFLFAHALCLDNGSLARRMARLVPYLLVVVAWQVVYSAGGDGSEGSGWYLHPLAEPLAYVTKLFERAPVLSLAQLTLIPADSWGLYPLAVKITVFLLAWFRLRRVRTRVLATGLGDVLVTRLDEGTLRVCADDGFLPSEFHQIGRGPSRPCHAGDVVELSNMKATVTEITNDGRPKTVEFRFAAPLESPE